MKSSETPIRQIIRFVLTFLLIGSSNLPNAANLRASTNSTSAPDSFSRTNERVNPSSQINTANGSAENAKSAMTRDSINQYLTRIPLAFEANSGQARADVKFLARGAGYELLLSSRDASLRLKGAETNRYAATSLRMRLLGANRAAKISGEDELAGKTNYFTGSEPSKWRAGVRNYARVRYAEIYRGVDVVYYGKQQKLEYDFIIAPNADASRIKLRFDGVRALRIDEQGDLLIGTEAGIVRQQKPFAYQETDGEKRAVEVSYVLHGKREIGFQIGEHDHAKPLVIDPTIAYSDAIGGNGRTVGSAIAADAAGNVYIAGGTAANNFPTTSGAFQKTFGGGGFGDAFVLKLNPSGTAFVYVTYLGGSNTDSATSIAVDSSGNAYVAGSTQSTNFPTANAFQSAKTSGTAANAFVTKLNPTGSALVYSTYLHGNDTQGASANGIAVDSAGSAYVTGSTTSVSFPVVNGLQTSYGGGIFGDAFLTKFTPAGNALAYSTYLGGSGNDVGYAIAVDSQGNAYITGQTDSSNLPTANPFQATNKNPGFNNGNAFVSKINTAATGASSLVYSTYLGGEFRDVGLGIAVDSQGSAYVTGRANSDNFPTTTGALKTNGFGIAFVTKFNPAGNTLAYSTYLGGSSDTDTQGSAIAVDSSGNAYVTGTTGALDFPLKNALQTKGGGGVFSSANAAAAWSLKNSGLPDDGTTALLVDPSNASIIYQANGTNGVMKSVDGGNSWTVANSGLVPPNVTALAFDPNNSSIIYAAGVVLSKSTNGGASWTTLPLGGGSAVNATAIAASSSTNLYVGTKTGKVFRSADGGATWTDFSNGLPTNGVRINALAAAPSSPATIYAGFNPQFGATSNGVYKIAENQTTWTAANTGLPNASGIGAQFINALVVDPTNPNTIYVATNGDPNVQNGGIYKTTNAGASWSPLVKTQFSNLSLAIDPTNTANIYVGTDIGSGIGILKSVDDGATWTASGLTNQKIVAVALSRAAPSTIYAAAQRATDQFISVLNPTGSALLFSTYYGGTGADFGQGIALDSQGNVYFTGSIYSSDFPKTPNTPRAVFGNDSNAASERDAEPLGNLKDTIPSIDNPFISFGEVGSLSTSGCPTITIHYDLVTDSSPLAGAFYQANLSVRGGNPPYSYSLSGNPPPGIGLSRDGEFTNLGLFQGRAITAGTYTFTINATDKNGCTGSLTGTIIVRPAPLAIDSVQPNDGREGDVFRITLNGSGGSVTAVDVNDKPANYVVKVPQPPPAKDSSGERDNSPSPVMPLANTTIDVTVPQGATTGPIHVTTSQGKLTSPLPFYVTKLPNAIDDPPFYVTQHYRDFLNREPDSAGLNFWVNQITSCNGDATCIDIKRQNVSAAYFLSREFQETGFFVITMNRAAFGRVSNDPSSRMNYQEFLFYAQQVGTGFIDGQAGADAVLDANKTAYAQKIAANPVFAQFYPTTLSASQYVDALFATAGVTPTAQERQDAINAFGAGDTNGRAASLRKVAESASVKTAEFRAAFVLLQYFGYLRRNPTDPPDNSDAGYQFWLTKLNNFGGDYIKSEMVRSFIVSAEYRNRFAPLSSP